MKQKLLSFIVIALLSITKNFSQTSPVGITGTGVPPDIAYSTTLITYKDEIHFAGHYNGLDLLKVDNSDNLIYLVKDVNPGSASSYPKIFFVSTSNELFFSANGSNTNNNAELWKSDGTDSGTIQAADFNGSITTGSSIEPMVEANNKLLMAAYTNFNFNKELAIYDLISGNSSIIDLNSSGSSSPENFFSYNGKAYFSAIETAADRELYVTDGTFSGTQLIKVNPTPNASNPNNFTAFNGKVYFSAKNDTNGNELWATDGTTVGTYLITDINSGINDSNPENLIVFGNRLYFTATSNSNGTELYYMAANESIVLHKDINAGSGSSNPSNLITYNGNLYFSADDGTNGEELWRTDGSIFGVGLFKDINPTSESRPRFPIKYNNKLYFVANDGSTGRELWSTDGTSSGTTLVADINATGDSEPISFTIANNILFFHATNGFARRLWKYIDPTLSTKGITINNTLKLFPNPTNNSFSIETSKTITSLDIYNVQGKIVKSFYTQLSNYNIEELNSGIYFVKMKSDNDVFTRKIIKN